VDWFQWVALPAVRYCCSLHAAPQGCISRAAYQAGPPHRPAIILAAPPRARRRVASPPPAAQLDGRQLPPGQQLALALQTADEALKGIAVELTVGEGMKE
jgi:hypothetical protein